MPTRRRPPKPHTKPYPLAVWVEPELGQAVDLWAARAGVNRSELLRYLVDEGVAKIRRNGRNWLRRRLVQKRPVIDTSASDAYFARVRDEIQREEKAGEH